MNKLGAKQLPGSALLFTMFILSAILVVALGGSHIISRSLVASGRQAQSVKAYFSAESGIEEILWEIRANNVRYGPEKQGTGEILLAGDLASEASYRVYHTFNKFEPQVVNNYTAIGTFGNTSRSVEVSF